MCPFSVTLQHVPDRELGPLLIQLGQAGFHDPIIKSVGADGTSDEAAAAAGPRTADLPDGWRLVGERKGQSYQWPGTRERYSRYRVFIGTTRAEGAVHIGLGETIRQNKWGRDRKYVVAFLSGGSPQQPLAEFVAADDYEETRELVAVIRGSDGGRRMYGAGDALPAINALAHARGDDPDERIRAVTIGEPQILAGPVLLAEYDPDWPQLFQHEADCIRDALGARTLQVEHVGSTSVPGLAAKPIIDISLTVADSADEQAFVPALEAAGYVLRIREPDWFEHRGFGRAEPRVNLHVFSAGCVEIDRMLRFRDRLRRDDVDRELYERTKRALAQRQWKYMQNYADAKSDVVEAILARAADPAFIDSS